YLTLMNKSKTSSLNLFSNALVDFYKTQMSFYKSSLDQLNSFMSRFDQRKISTSLVSFNLNQSEDKQLLKDVSIKLAQLPKPKHHRTPSNFFNLNEKLSSFQNYSNLSSSVTNLAKVSSDSKKSDVSLNISQMSNMSMSSIDLRINPNPQSSNEKIGFLFKRTHNSKVRKHWIKRRCKAASGQFFIYHSDETLEPVKLSLITCIVKPVDSTRFKIFSGSNSRIYEFMCEYEADFADWISILNTAKNNAFEKEMSDNISLSTITNATTNNSSESNSSTLKNEKDNERACELIVKNMLRHLVKVKGNDRCADCEAPDPDWLVTNLGVFVCIECCGIHREMGVQVSKTQSIKIDRLNTSQLI
ncbi:arf-GAP with SH3 ANK repeat and PH domain-containing 1-like, partial [Brachionus plicatilis]